MIPLVGVDALSLLLFGGMGVSLFFVLSGYLLSWTEGRRVARGERSLRLYAKRRALRILPAYYAVIPIIVLFWPTNPSAKDVLLNAVFVHVFFNPFDANTLDPAFWSLTSEIVFYCCLPFFVLPLGLRGRLILSAALFVASAIGIHAQVLIYQGAPATLGPFNLTYLVQLPTHLFLFSAGATARALVERGVRPPRVIASGLFVGACGLFVVLAYPPQIPTFLATWWGFVPVLAVLSLFGAALFGAPVLRQLLSFGPLVFVGSVSYSMFLINDTVLVAVGPRFLDFSRGFDSHWAGFLFFALPCFFLIVLVSWLGYRYVESPFLKMKPK